MKAYRNILFAALAAFVTGCLPAEELIEDTGVAFFTASFETVQGAQALWEEGNRVLVVDSFDSSHRFALDFGEGSADGEFSGDISPKSTVKYVAYAGDDSSIEFESEQDVFSMEIPFEYNGHGAGRLVTANNAAVGILQGSQVEMKSLCGFIKLTLEPNGETLLTDGESHNLTDIRRVIITSGDGKCLSGRISASWNPDTRAPEFIDIRDGSNTVTFNSCKLSSYDGSINYEAGDYYIPVAPQTYEQVVITLEDNQGHTTSLPERTIDVSRATEVAPGSMEWPTVVVSANFLCSSAEESKQHEVASFASDNLMCDRVSQTTGQTVEGKSKKNTVVDFEHQGVNYQLFATNGYGRSSNTGGCLLSLTFNTYTPNWSFSSDTWTVGSPNGYAWVRIPEHEGLLTKIELTIISKDGTPFNISSEVNPETGRGIADIVASRPCKAATSTYETQTLFPVNTKPGIAYYICVGNGHTYRIQAWKFYYKKFND